MIDCPEDYAIEIDAQNVDENGIDVVNASFLTYLPFQSSNSNKDHRRHSTDAERLQERITSVK